MTVTWKCSKCGHANEYDKETADKALEVAKVKAGRTILMRLCASRALKFCTLVYDFPGTDGVKKKAKRFLYKDWRAEV